MSQILTVKAVDPTKPVAPGNCQVFLNGNEIEASALTLQIGMDQATTVCFTCHVDEVVIQNGIEVVDITSLKSKSRTYKVATTDIHGNPLTNSRGEPFPNYPTIEGEE